MKVLVIGARQDNLGEAIADNAALFHPSVQVETADRDPHTWGHEIDVTDLGSISTVLSSVEPTVVVYSAGVNFEDAGPDTFFRQMEVNFYGAMLVFEEWLAQTGMAESPSKYNHGFVTISSNSAHVARSTSAGYCASKAALSAWTRCTGRRYAGGQPSVWGYEPGWVSGTPMSRNVQSRVASGVLHRIPGGKGINKSLLGRRIAEDMIRAMVHGDNSLNGTMIRCDGGDQ